MRTQFADVGIAINPASDLGRLIELAIDYSENGLPPSDEPGHVRALLNGQHVDRLAQAASVLTGHPDSKTHLWPLKKGAIGPGDRSPSRAKDKLWELELLHLLRSRNVTAELREPDVMVALPSGELAIACKRIYSAKNAELQLSTGVRQISNATVPGLLAVCVDDLLPPYCIVEARSPDDAVAFLDNHNIDFLNRHHTRLAGYIAAKRLCGVLVASSAAIRHPPEVGEIAVAMQSTIWTTPQCGADQLLKMEELGALLFESPTGQPWLQVEPSKR
ncbi:hypothetical protein [Lysobacter sp. TY2-98]|uniref:hypothetical protein n=1 Tax=Lysobacter sp. TY2-98 TaxID=2290922 RepID=UPI0013B40300|nr:hypothetical protein [Lysobacter sp. TY2-98]